MSEEIILEARDIWHSYEENDRFSCYGDWALKVKKGGVRLLLWEPTVLENLRFFSAATEFYDHKREIFCFMENR
ncbi:MAG: hypothetical protein ACLVC1_08120 [Mediterraneibacter gnavus]